MIQRIRKQRNQNFTDFVLTNSGNLDSLYSFVKTNNIMDMSEYYSTDIGKRYKEYSTPKNNDLDYLNENSLIVTTGQVRPSGDFNNDFNFDFYTFD